MPLSVTSAVTAIELANSPALNTAAGDAKGGCAPTTGGDGDDRGGSGEGAGDGRDGEGDAAATGGGELPDDAGKLPVRTIGVSTLPTLALIVKPSVSDSAAVSLPVKKVKDSVSPSTSAYVVIKNADCPPYGPNGTD